jgi:hypothetical protein
VGRYSNFEICGKRRYLQLRRITPDGSFTWQWAQDGPSP